ncbi:hypothetical protein DL768_005066 [Monosporascus sp. mg162]|nr:hypothetical protein DL768_005066 [Monosporascus sp. mg162]
MTAFQEPRESEQHRQTSVMANRRVLVIAGSDSSGGAMLIPGDAGLSGLEADQKVIAAHGCYAMTATTALTAQNTTSVEDIHEVPPEFTRKQIDAVFGDIVPGVVKIGMLASAATIEMVARALKDYDVETVVLDPVMVSTTGAQLLPFKAVDELRTLLLPHAFILTPNMPEAKLLLSRSGKESVDVQRVGDLETLARKTQELGPKWVLIKGGHVPFKRDGTIASSDEEKEVVVDVLIGPSGELTRIEGAYQNSRNTHGTGCSLASAIASNLSKGIEPVEAVRAACSLPFAPYLLDIGQSGDWIGLQTGLSPCLLGYGAIAKQLHSDPATKKDGNAYWPWILNYVADDYVDAVKTGSALLERHAPLLSPSRIEELVEIFIQTTKLEIGFWEMFPSK